MNLEMVPRQIESTPKGYVGITDFDETRIVCITEALSKFLSTSTESVIQQDVQALQIRLYALVRYTKLI
jgi:hypothetical protein